MSSAITEVWKAVEPFGLHVSLSVLESLAMGQWTKWINFSILFSIVYIALEFSEFLSDKVWKQGRVCLITN